MHVKFEENIFPFSTMNAPTMSNYNFLENGILLLAHSQLYTTPQMTPSPHITTPSSPSHTAQQSSPSQSSPTTQDITTSQTTPISNINSPSPTPTSETQTSPTSPPQHIITHVSPHAPFSPQMKTRSQQGIFKPRQLFNLHTSTPQSISPLPTNLIDALKDHN